MTYLLVQIFKLFLSLGEIVRTPMPQGENVVYKYLSTNRYYVYLNDN